MTSNTDPDRLRNLPDAILITILSFLKPREAVQTCVLSKKWRNLWTFIPCLAFKCDDFVQDRNPIEKRYSNYNLNREDLERFQNFVSMFLRLRDNSTAVQFFRLHHTKLACNPEISGLNEMWAGLSNMWIRYALKHNVKKIVLRGHECFNLLDRLFTCESLEDLCMDLVFGCFNNDLVFIMPNIIFLPKLKNLHIENVNMGGNCVERLISGCPNLESLSLSCNVMMQNNISLHFLKQLYLDRCSFLPSMFYISAPCVEYLYIWGHLECGAKLEDISRVKKAKIHFHKEMDFELYNCEVVSSLLGVENLHMEAYGVLKEVLEGELPNCRTFHNLKKLTLGKRLYAL